MGRPQDAFMLFDYALKESSYGAGVIDGGITTWPKLTSPGLAIQTTAYPWQPDRSPLCTVRTRNPQAQTGTQE